MTTIPRISRKSFDTPYFHVMSQGNNKDFIFQNSIDVKYYIKTMYQICQQYELNIISYCVMGNHVHILIKVYNISELSKFMQRINTKYGIYYNKKYNRIGHVFRDRFRSEGIFNSNHLLNCIKYIYDNPVKAGICNTPEDYPYSNYNKIPLKVSGSYNFIDTYDDKKIEIKQIIDNYLFKEKIKKTELLKNKDVLKELVILLHEKYDISLRLISFNLEIGRETIRKLV